LTAKKGGGGNKREQKIITVNMTKSISTAQIICLLPKNVKISRKTNLGRYKGGFLIVLNGVIITYVKLVEAHLVDS